MNKSMIKSRVKIIWKLTIKNKNFSFELYSFYYNVRNQFEKNISMMHVSRSKQWTIFIVQKYQSFSDKLYLKYFMI